MLSKLRLVNFRSFRDFTVSFSQGAYLVGPNNAGKSTILTALRTADVLLRYARSRKPTLSVEHNNRKFPAYPLILNEFPALQESVRHEFRNSNEARFELTWKSGAKLVAVWPGETDYDEDSENFFYLEKQPGFPVRDTLAARSSFPQLGVIPLLGPIEHSEGLRDDRYVRSNVSTRLSSRHFRNQLRLMKEDGTLSNFIEYASGWLDGIKFDSFDHHYNENDLVLDVYYTEQGSIIPKELVWAGDGIQVWIQILYHVYRTQDLDTLILDEPEVYLHADLQRKLVHLVETTGRQIILATHSSEMIAEADPRLVTLVEKTRKYARRTTDTAQLELVSRALGTAFNLRLAKALRSNVALFVEGNDMVILRRLAETLEMNALATERNIAVIPLEGYSRSPQVAPFAWLCRELLPEAIKVFVILDHDYRPTQLNVQVEESFTKEGISAHVWKRKEIESYLLTPEVIARITGVSTENISLILDAIAASMENHVFGRMLAEEAQNQRSSGIDSSVTMTDFKNEFDSFWQDSQRRLHSCPAKEVLSELNKKLHSLGAKAVSVRMLASSHRAYEVPPELVAVLRKVEEAATAQEQ